VTTDSLEPGLESLGIRGAHIGKHWSGGYVGNSCLKTESWVLE